MREGSIQAGTSNVVPRMFRGLWPEIPVEPQEQLEALVDGCELVVGNPAEEASDALLVD